MVGLPGRDVLCSVVTRSSYGDAAAPADPVVGAMSPPSPDEFAALLGRLDRASFARFLAALWAARGRPTSVDEGVVVDGDRRVRVHAPRRWFPGRLAALGIGPGGADAIATTHPGAAAQLRSRGIKTVGPADLRRTLLYGIDRPTADRLCRTHLGRSLDTGPPDPRGSGILGSGLSPSPTLVVVVLLGVAALAVAGLGLPADVPAAGSGTDAVDGADTPAPPDGAATPTPGSTGWTGEADDLDDIGARDIAPGVTTRGVTNASALAAAHADAVAGRSYEWRVEFEAPSGSNPVVSGERTQTRITRVEAGRAVRRDVFGSGDPPGAFLAGTDADVYAADGIRYVRANGSVAAAPRTNAAAVEADRAGARAVALVVRFLDAEETDAVAVVDRNGETYYRVVARGTDERVVARYEASALVSSSGFVARLAVAYRLGDGTGTGTVSVISRYSARDGVRVERPTWVPAPADDGTNESVPRPTPTPTSTPEPGSSTPTSSTVSAIDATAVAPPS